MRSPQQRREYNRKWKRAAYKANPEKFREAVRKWRASRPPETPEQAEERKERARERGRRWRAANLRKRRKYEREWMRKRRAANPEKDRQYQRAWRAANPVKVNEYSRNWRRAHLDEVRKKERKRARKRRRTQTYREYARNFSRKLRAKQRALIEAGRIALSARPARGSKSRGRPRGLSAETVQRCRLAAAFLRAGMSQRAMARHVLRDQPDTAEHNIRRFFADHREQIMQFKESLSPEDVFKLTVD